MIYTKEIKEKLITMNNDTMTTANRLLDESYNRALAMLQPGEPAPFKKILDQEAKDQYQIFLEKSKAEAHTIIDEALEALYKEKAAAPSQEAVNYISMLALRDGMNTLTKEDITSAVTLYGDNYTAFKTIKDLAKKNKIYLDGNHVIDEVMEELETQNKEFAQRGVFNAEIYANKAYIAMINMTIETIPDIAIISK